MPELSKEQLVASINADINDNVVGDITPEDIRSNLIDIVDSVHLLASGESLFAANFSTFGVNNVRGGDLSMYNQYNNPQYMSSGNTAYGYHTMYDNYSGGENSALGAYALSCIVFGSGNTAVGYDALGGSVYGSNNTAVGRHALKKNRDGHNSVAIGNYAGYYNNDDYRFYLASHNLTDAEVLTDPSGDNVTPTMYGDLLNNKIAINSDSLHNDGHLQVNGNITPSEDDHQDSLGTNQYGWLNVWTKSIRSSDKVTLQGDFVPQLNGAQDLGSAGSRFDNGYINNLVVSGSAFIEDLTYSFRKDSASIDKTLWLATSGVDGSNNPAPYLTDEGLAGAGLIVQSTGLSYSRDYEFLFQPSDLAITNLDADNVYSRSSWRSNISFQIEPGRHLRTSRVLGFNYLDLLGSGGKGYFIGSDLVYGNDTQKAFYDLWSSTPDITYFSPSGDTHFVTARLAEHSGVVVGDNLYSRYDGTTDFYGFKRQYIDAGDINDRYVLSSYNGDDMPIAGLTMMRDSGTLGFTNSNYAEAFVPETIFNVLSSGDGAFRLATQESGVAIQLSAGDNSLDYGAELKYDLSSEKITLKGYEGGTEFPLVTTYKKRVGINNVDPQEAFTVSESDKLTAVIALQEISGGTPVTDTIGYGKIYARPNVNPSKSQDLFFQDDEGNVHDILGVSGDIASPEFVYWDNDRNTYIGYSTPVDRGTVNTFGSTAVGYAALSGITQGNYNVAIGSNTASHLGSGNNNIFIGFGDISNSSYDISNTFVCGQLSNPLLSGVIPSVDGRGSLSVRDSLSVVSSGDLSTVTLERQGKNTVFNIDHIEDDTNLVFRFNNQDLFRLNSSGEFVGVSGDLNISGSLGFDDGTSISSASGLKTVTGSGIEVDYSFGDSGVINLDFSSLPTTSGLDLDTFMAVSGDGFHGKAAISELLLFSNAENPQTFWVCPSGYNTLLTNDTYLNHSKNCNVILSGKDAGNFAQNHVNSIMLGVQAGQNSSIENNNSLENDTSCVWVGHNAGNRSKNSSNSVFMGPSAGQDTSSTNLSVFIGPSAGQTSRSSRSIGIGDNVLEQVVGSNNIELSTNGGGINRLINGTCSDKINIGGVIAGDSCAGRISIGGASRIYPAAVCEVAAHSEDVDVNLQNWYNASGDIVAYLDQMGNLHVAGTIAESQTLLGSNNVPATMPDILTCGNSNETGSESPSDGGGGPTLDPGSDPGGGSGPDGGNIDPPDGYLLSYEIIKQDTTGTIV